MEPIPVELPAPPAAQLTGAQVKAIRVAADDLIALREAPLKEVPDADEVVRCMARLESYDVQVREQADHFVVTIIPVGERCVTDGSSILGGDATYEISKDRFLILRRDLGE